jgi:hypothetical protein
MAKRFPQFSPSPIDRERSGRGLSKLWGSLRDRAARKRTDAARRRHDESGMCAGGGGKIRPNPHFRVPNQHHRFGRLRQRVVDGQKSPSPALMTGRQRGHALPFA